MHRENIHYLNTIPRHYTREVAVRVSVYNNGRWVAKDYDYFGYGARVEVYKHRRGDFRFSAWYLR